MSSISNAGIDRCVASTLALASAATGFGVKKKCVRASNCLATSLNKLTASSCNACVCTVSAS